MFSTEQPKKRAKHDARSYDEMHIHISSDFITEFDGLKTDRIR